MDAEQPATETTGPSPRLNSSLCYACECLQGKLAQEPQSWSTRSLRLDSHLVLASLFSLSSQLWGWFLCICFVAFSPCCVAEDRTQCSCPELHPNQHTHFIKYYLRVSGIDSLHQGKTSQVLS